MSSTAYRASQKAARLADAVAQARGEEETPHRRESSGGARPLSAPPLSDAEGALREIRRIAWDLESPGADPAVAAIASEIRARVRHALGEAE